MSATDKCCIDNLLSGPIDFSASEIFFEEAAA